jgi:hypothetical protein
MLNLISFCEASPSGFIFSFLNSSFSLSMPPPSYEHISFLSSHYFNESLLFVHIYAATHGSVIYIYIYIYIHIASAFPNHLKADRCIIFFADLLCLLYLISHSISTVRTLRFLLPSVLHYGIGRKKKINK